jgi:hypothetical protein
MIPHVVDAYSCIVIDQFLVHDHGHFECVIVSEIRGLLYVIRLVRELKG